jgi:hypothetical protein
LSLPCAEEITFPDLNGDFKRFPINRKIHKFQTHFPPSPGVEFDEFCTYKGTGNDKENGS